MKGWLLDWFGCLASFNCRVHIRIGMSQAFLYRYLIIRHVWELIVYYVCVSLCVSVRNIPKHACTDHTHAHIHVCIHWPHSHTHTHECMHWPHSCAHPLPTLRGRGGQSQWVCLLCCHCRLLSLPIVSAHRHHLLHRTESAQNPTPEDGCKA